MNKNLITYEMCPECDAEIKLSLDKLYDCPECGHKEVLPCSVCEFSHNTECDWDEESRCRAFPAIEYKASGYIKEPKSEPKSIAQGVDQQQLWEMEFGMGRRIRWVDEDGQTEKPIIFKSWVSSRDPDEVLPTFKDENGTEWTAYGTLYGKWERVGEPTERSEQQINWEKQFGEGKIRWSEWKSDQKSVEFDKWTSDDNNMFKTKDGDMWNADKILSGHWLNVDNPKKPEMTRTEVEITVTVTTTIEHMDDEDLSMRMADIYLHGPSQDTGWSEKRDLGGETTITVLKENV